MSADDITPGADAPAASAPAAPEGQSSRPAFKRFVPRSAATRMPADAAARQGRVTSLAMKAWGTRDAVLAFLNTHDDELGGRPIDLAVADAAGLAAVEAAIAARAPGAGGAEPGDNPDRGRAPSPAATSNR